MPRYGQTPATPEVVLPPVQPPSEAVLKLRADVRLAYISQFVALFSPHVNLEFNIEDLEADLEGSRPNCCVPTLLGKLCNTLANDRNTNASNWMLALRRAYNRRLPQEDNPFYRYVRVPIPLEEDNKGSSAPEQEEGEKQGEKEVKVAPAEEIKQDDALDVKMEVDAPADASTSLNPEATPTAEPLPAPSADAPTASAVVCEPPAASTPAEAANNAPVEEKEGDEPKLGEVEATEGAVEVDEMELDYYEDRIDIEWSEVDLETKIQAIYNICHWHMNDAERFRRNLKFEDDASWRIEPIGSDVKKNQYYFFDDNRLWIHRAPPPPPRSHKASTSASTSKSKPSKGKGKASNSTKPVAATSNNNKRPRSPSPELGAPKEEKRPAPPPESPNKRARVSRVRNEEWEEIPPELQAEWAKESEVKEEVKEPIEEDLDARREREESSSSALTSLLDEDEEDEEVEEEKEEEKPKPAPRPTNKKGAEEAESDYDPEEEDEEDDTDSIEERSEWGVDEDGLMKWERDFWAERDRIKALEGFVEWEAICVTRKEWEAFADKFNTSKNRNERALRDLLKTEILPKVIATIDAKEKAQIQEIIAMNRKRSTRIATKESEEDEKARIAAEKAAESSKLSRASRHKIIANLNGEDSTSETGSSKGAVQETREDRLRKREEEKAAREAAAEAAQMEEVKRLEREAAIAANGGVVPPGMETPEELEAMRLEKEKEEKRIAREQAKEAKEADKKARTKAAKEARASAKAVEVQETDEEPPWYLDCEICKDAGWNMDDGRDLLSCDKCEEWQHLQCHIQANAIPGKPPIDFGADDFSFVCARCRLNPTRPRRIPPPNLPPPRPYIPIAPPPAVKKGRPKKEPPKPPKPAPPRPSPAERKQQREKPPAPAAPPAAKNGASSTSPPAPAASIPGPGQPPLSYDALKALIESQPVLINQLPAQYQQHFSQLLKISVPYPTSASPALPAPKPTPAPQPAASPPAPTPATAPAPAPAPSTAPQPQTAPPAPSVVPSAPTPAPIAAPSSHPHPIAVPQGGSAVQQPLVPSPAVIGNGSA
ncbi:hypothetical protein BCR35DRAFT_308868 [Leucosporidium creatinivorum]|uniref:PHD-type domain-containing protein n=1 Tax=Leucosporidium creatinivorum TaxID=106004 RepID=A0A1Y2DUI1_9BASI|nr:hypothetical protein BCR35DRAFT_308868 [Leucosporidium creatinivorum]